MCMQDWRVARLIRHNVIFAAATSGTIPANQQRVGLIIAPVSAPSAPGNDALFLDSGANGLTFYARDMDFTSEVLSVINYGSLLTDAILFRNASDTAQMCITELTMPEDYLAAGLAEFMSQYKLESPYGNARPSNV